MRSTVARLSLILALAAVLAMLGAPLAVGSAAAGTTWIPIENYFLSCTVVSVEKVWTEGGVMHVRGRELAGEVISDREFHTGPATNWANANVNLETGYATFHGKLEMRPTAFPEGWWEGNFSIQGLPGEQTGIARLKGYGTMEGYLTKTAVTHMPGWKLHDLFPEACGGNEPIGGSRAVGYVMIPGGG